MVWIHGLPVYRWYWFWFEPRQEWRLYVCVVNEWTQTFGESDGVDPQETYDRANAKAFEAPQRYYYAA